MVTGLFSTGRRGWSFTIMAAFTRRSAIKSRWRSGATPWAAGHCRSNSSRQASRWIHHLPDGIAAQAKAKRAGWIE